MYLRDLIGNAHYQTTAQASMAIADAVQKIEQDKGAQLLALACAFLLAAEESGLSVQDFMTYAKNCMNEQQGKRPEFAAVAAYIRNEILKY